MRTRVKKLIAWSLVLIVTPLVILFLHVYSVTRSSEKPGTNWHLTRIEFQESPLDSLTILKAQSVIDTIPEVMDSYLNSEKGTLVYATAKGSYKSQEVFDRFMRAGHFEASQYVPEKGVGPVTSCPVLDKKSLTYRIGSIFQDLMGDNKTK
ncbi:hypothetical protein FNH22_07790 [Fulvivirga sp. M361]|uniref:hypothetical protein n=1 Tax=Fulvivirga sp. M361 TaxID=2594266 RepID=UPI00117AC3CC|nr:hypothetical protein [Fulvivirga sp. M361]TRX59946.1 hypothetical protein FNH22_07790 [Fulvivirga sp. M361]